MTVLWGCINTVSILQMTVLRRRETNEHTHSRSWVAEGDIGCAPIAISASLEVGSETLNH